MDRRDFLKMSSMTALLAAGELTGLSKVFAHDSSPLKQESFNSGNTSSNMEYRELGGLDVSAIGLGCLPMVGYYGGKYEKKDMIALIRRAYDKGVTFFDTAEVYGPYTSEEWVGEAPVPVSSTVSVNTPSLYRVVSVIVPLSVNLIALESRLPPMLKMRFLSPFTTSFA